MGLILNQIFKLIKLLNSETGTNQIAAGVAAGFVLGMAPVFSLQTLLIFFLIFLFRIQAGAAFVSAFFFAFMAYLLDPVFHIMGYKILQVESLQSLYTTLFNMPLLPMTRFNNTVVMGAGVTSLLLFPIVFVLSKVLIAKYRKSVLERFKQTKFWKAVKATSLYKWYFKYDELYGE